MPASTHATWLQRDINRLQSQLRALAKGKQYNALPVDPVIFCREILHFNPTAYQEQFLRDNNSFIALLGLGRVENRT